MVVINGIRHKKLRRSSVNSALLLTLIVSPPLSINSSLAQEKEAVVRRINGVTTASIIVPVSPSQAWSVLTNHESTALHMPDIKEVKLISRKGTQLKIEQTYKGAYTFGLKIKALIQVEEKPKSMINYQLIKGNLIQKLEGNWILIPVSNGTLIAHRIEIDPALPGFLKPLFIGRFERNLKNSMLILRQLILEES